VCLAWDKSRRGPDAGGVPGDLDADPCAGAESALDHEAVVERLGDLGYDGPHNAVKFRGNQAVHPVHLAQANGFDLDIIHEL